MSGNESFCSESTDFLLAGRPDVEVLAVDGREIELGRGEARDLILVSRLSLG